MSSSVEFIRWCGGTVGLKSEERGCYVRDGHVVTFFGQGVSPWGIVDYRFFSLLRSGNTPQDVRGVEIPFELLEIGGPDSVCRALESACTFPNLEWLNIQCASVSADDVRSLAKLSRLKLLVVNATSDRTALLRLLDTNPQTEIYLTDSETLETRLVR